jgi:hypothetical protein
LAATAVSVELASRQASEDTRSALFLVFALLVVLIGTYTTVVNDMRGEQSLRGAEVPAAEALPELPDSPSLDPAPELPDSPEFDLAPELPDSSGLAPAHSDERVVESDPELPDQSESGDEELPGEPAVETDEDPELPDAEPEFPDAGTEVPVADPATTTP